MLEENFTGFMALAGLLLVSAFFSGAETAIIGARRVTLHDMSNKGSKSAARVLKLLENPGRLLGTILVGNNLVNVTAAAIATTVFGPAKATVIVTVALLLVGEIPPKTIAASWPETFSRLVSLPITFFTWVFSPVVWFTTALTDLVLWPIRKKLGQRRRFYSKDELRTALDISQDAGELEPGEAQMVYEVMDLVEVKISELMIPVKDMARLDSESSEETILQEIHRSRFTRYPVFVKGNGRLLGLLHIKDLVVRRYDASWRSQIRPMMLRDENMEANDLLREMQISRQHMVGVTNAKGELAGFVTMEDILEEIVGEIADEHDREQDPVKELSENVYRVRPDLEIGDINTILNVDIPAEDPDQNIEDFFRSEVKAHPASILRVGPVMIKPSRRKGLGYVIQVCDEKEEGEES